MKTISNWVEDVCLVVFTSTIAGLFGFSIYSIWTLNSEMLHDRLSMCRSFVHHWEGTGDSNIEQSTSCDPKLRKDFFTRFNRRNYQK